MSVECRPILPKCSSRIVGECRRDRLRLVPVVVRFLGEGRIDWQHRARAHGHQLQLRGAFEEHSQHGRVLDRITSGELAVMGGSCRVAGRRKRGE